MVFQPIWTEESEEIYNRLRAQAAAAQESRKKSGKKKATRAEGLFNQVRKCIDFLLENPRHPGLNTHEFRTRSNPYDEDAKVFEAYAQQNTPAAYRVFWCYGPEKGQITILTITAHP